MAEPDDQARLDRHFDNIAETALADLQTLAANGGGMGVFYLPMPIIDALAQAATTSRRYWDVFMADFMPADEKPALVKYATLADVMYSDFRNPGTHALSASSRFRFTSGGGLSGSTSSRSTTSGTSMRDVSLKMSRQPSSR